MTAAQRGVLASNNSLLSMFTVQMDMCKELVSLLDSNTIHDRYVAIAGALPKAGKHSDIRGCVYPVP